MKKVLIIISLGIAFHLAIASPDRGVNQMANMIRKLVLPYCGGYWIGIQFAVTMATGYGCYCGKTSDEFYNKYEGKDVYINDVDKLCYNHDKCYLEANCGPLDTYIKPYNYQMDDDAISCLDQEGSCNRKICECDRHFVIALAEEIKSGTACPTSDPGCPVSKSFS